MILDAGSSMFLPPCLPLIAVKKPGDVYVTGLRSVLVLFVVGWSEGDSGDGRPASKSMWPFRVVLNDIMSSLTRAIVDESFGSKDSGV